MMNEERKKYYSATSSKSIVEMVDRFDYVIITDDARTLPFGEIPIIFSGEGDEDYDKFSINQLMEYLTLENLRNICTFYALNNLEEAVNSYGFKYSITKKQKKLLREYHNKRSSYSLELDNDGVCKLIQLICDSTFLVRVYGHDNDNLHQLQQEMFQKDYLEIIKSIPCDEYKGLVTDDDTDRFGAPLYKFVHDPHGYKLKYSGQTLSNDIQIYVKILLEFENECNLCVLSFNSMEPESPE